LSSLTSSFEIHWENMIWTSSKVRSKILLTFTKKVFHVKDRNKLQPYARHKPYAYTEYINQKRKTIRKTTTNAQTLTMRAQLCDQREKHEYATRKSTTMEHNIIQAKAWFDKSLVYISERWINPHTTNQFLKISERFNLFPNINWRVNFGGRCGNCERIFEALVGAQI